MIIIGDDISYSDFGCYGGEIATPNIDKVAARGIRFTQFHTESIKSTLETILPRLSLHFCAYSNPFWLAGFRKGIHSFLNTDIAIIPKPV